MVKLVVKKGDTEFYVFRKVKRASDPEPWNAAMSMAAARMYSMEAFTHLVETGKMSVHHSERTGDVYVLVCVNAPQLLGGKPEGFFKIVKRRFGLGHVQTRASKDAMMTLTPPQPAFCPSPNSAFKPYKH